MNLTSFSSEGKLYSVASHSTEGIDDQFTLKAGLDPQSNVLSNPLRSHRKPALCWWGERKTFRRGLMASTHSWMIPREHVCDLCFCTQACSAAADLYPHIYREQAVLWSHTLAGWNIVYSCHTNGHKGAACLCDPLCHRATNKITSCGWHGPRLLPCLWGLNIASVLSHNEECHQRCLDWFCLL